MAEAIRGAIPTLGALRVGLLLFAASDILVPLVDGLARHGSPWPTGGHAPTYVLIASAMAPILFVVLLFDFIMSRVRAADAGAAGSARFRAIGRVELIAMAVLLAYWMPVLASLGR